MLVKITTQCQMGCSHCMEDAGPIGEFMSMETFDKTLEFIKKVYGGLQLIMLSGGEPLEHSSLLEMLDKLEGWRVLILTNGLLLNSEIGKDILSRDIHVQVYNDPRYYPIKVEPIIHPNVLFADKINMLSPLGRAAKMKCERSAPLCYNFRSCVRAKRDFVEGLMTLRRSAGKMCCPSVDVDGNVIAGESRLCYKIGTVESPFGVLANNLLNMKCNRCGLENNLGKLHRAVIGLPIF